MTKNSSLKSTLISEAASQVAERLQDQIEEKTGGLPSPETERRLAQDEMDAPLEDCDFFDFCEMSYTRNGIPIVYYVKKEGKYVNTLPPPLSWNTLRDLYGPGHYTVVAKDQRSMAFKKQKTEILEALPEPLEDTSSGLHLPQQSSSDISSILALMARQDERREQADREARERDEQRRADDRRRDEEQKKEAKESRNSLLQMLIPLGLPILERMLSPKTGIDPALQMMIDQLKESNRALQEQSSRNAQATSSLDTKTLLDMEQKARERETAARKEGREEMEKIYEIAEERAEARAEELVKGQGEKSDTVTEALIKGLAPALGAMLLQGKTALPTPETPEAIAPAEEAVVNNVTPIQGKSSKARPTGKPITPKAPRLSEEDQKRQKVMEIVMPILVDAYQKLASGARPTPEGAARESLEALQIKGFKGDQAVTLFTQAHLNALVLSRLPQEVHSWFNSYYAALVAQSRVSSDAPVPESLATRSPVSGQSPEVSNPSSSGGNAG